MTPFERIWDAKSRVPVLVATGLLTILIALSDWWTKPYFSMGFLYLFPIMMASAFLPRLLIVVCGLCSAMLTGQFLSLQHCLVRFGFQHLGAAGLASFLRAHGGQQGP